MSLRVRLLIATGVAVLCGLIVVDVITFSVVTRSLVQQVDDTLQRVVAPIEHDDHLGVRAYGLDAPQDFHSVQARHLDVGHEHVERLRTLGYAD